MRTLKKESRRRLLAILGALSLFPLLKLPIGEPRRKTVSCAPPPKPGSPNLHMLGQDGRLVIVDASRITVLKKKISDEELKEWVNHS